MLTNFIGSSYITYMYVTYIELKMVVLWVVYAYFCLECIDKASDFESEDCRIEFWHVWKYKF